MKIELPSQWVSDVLEHFEEVEEIRPDVYRVKRKGLPAEVVDMRELYWRCLERLGEMLLLANSEDRKP